MRVSDSLKKKLTNNGWLSKLQPFFESPEWGVILDNLKGQEVTPPRNLIFRCFDIPFDSVRCVILGQDPYPQPNVANGLAFGSHTGLARPPSLRNILKEVEMDLGCFLPKSDNSLLGWQQQGVFLYNTHLTTAPYSVGAHMNVGWDKFAAFVIKMLCQEKQNLVFMVWGNKAKELVQKELSFSDLTNNLFLYAAHPSPQSVYNGFAGCKHFSQANEFLVKKGFSPIDWTAIDSNVNNIDSLLPIWTEKDERHEQRKFGKFS